jgi:hypothetical protein
MFPVRISSYSTTVAIALTTKTPNMPIPTILTAPGTVTLALAPVASAPVFVAPPLDVLLATPLPLGVPVALDVWFPEQNIVLGFTPLSMKHACSSATVWSYDRQKYPHSPLNCSTAALLQHWERASEVLEGTPRVLPTAQKTSVVGNCVKSAVEQDALLAVGAAEELTSDMVVV